MTDMAGSLPQPFSHTGLLHASKMKRFNRRGHLSYASIVLYSTVGSGAYITCSSSLWSLGLTSFPPVGLDP